jgi:o-succinylbenzoate---CoA ligase
MVDYPFTHIWTNGRHVSLRDIISRHVPAISGHEAEAFSFIRDWCEGRQTFELTTSGSTGAPKKIVVTRDQMRASALLTKQALDLREGYHALLGLDAKFIAGKMMLVRSFVCRMKIFVVDPCANPLIKIPVDQRIHFMALVPYQVTTILESKHPQLLESLLVAIIGGAPLDEFTYEKLTHFTPKFFLTYGMTETLSHVALRPVEKDGDLRYHTLPGITVRADDRSCLVVKTPFLDEEVITNDVVDIFNTHAFIWRGRYDNVINSGGIKLSPEIMEQKIGKIFTRLKITNRFFIHQRPDEKLGQRAVLVIEEPIPDESTRGLMIESFDKTFAPFEAPTEVYSSDAFVMTETQKINRPKSFLASRLVDTFFN